MLRHLLLAALLTLTAAEAQTVPATSSAAPTTLAQVAVTGTVIQKI